MVSMIIWCHLLKSRYFSAAKIHQSQKLIYELMRLPEDSARLSSIFSKNYSVFQINSSIIISSYMRIYLPALKDVRDSKACGTKVAFAILYIESKNCCLRT